MNPIFVGLFELSGPRSNPHLDGFVGAFVWVAAQAEDAAKLELRVTNVSRDLGLFVVGSDEIREVVEEDKLSDSVAKLIPEARRNVDSVVFGTWHKFENQDA